MRGSWLLLTLLTGCTAAPVRPAADKLAPWTTSLRDQQPEDAFAAVYRVGGKRLVFVAAKHANRTDSLTFRMIEDAFGQFKFDVVLGEGFPTSRGPNPASIIAYARNSKVTPDGFVEAGETQPMVLGALKEGAVLWGGENDDRAVMAQVAANGISGRDLLGFYVLRTIPQWIGEEKIKDAGDPRLQPLATLALARHRAALGLADDTLPDFAAWASWYRALNGRSLGADFVTEEIGPLADGRFATNRIAYAVSRARDDYLHRLIIQHLNAGADVLVVFGASHLMIQRPALDAALGPPCYVGSQLRQASAACR